MILETLPTETFNKVFANLLINVSSVLSEMGLRPQSSVEKAVCLFNDRMIVFLGLSIVASVF